MSAYDLVVEATNEFTRYRDRLTRRLDRARREPRREEYAKLRSLWEAWERAYGAWEQAGSPDVDVIGLVQVLMPPPPWDEFEDEFGPEPPFEPPPDTDLEAEPDQAVERGVGSTPREWPIELLQDIYDLARDGHGRPTIQRALEDTSYPCGLWASDYVVRWMLDLVHEADDDGRRRLAVTLAVIRELPPARRVITLEDLRNRVLEPNPE